MSVERSTTDHPSTDASTADLLRQLSEQTTRLFGGAGIFGLYAFGALTAAIIAALSLAMATWLAALIVAVVYGAVAAVLALTGRTKVQQAMPPVPQDSVDSVKEDVQWTKTRAQQGRR